MTTENKYEYHMISCLLQVLLYNCLVHHSSLRFKLP